MLNSLKQFVKTNQIPFFLGLILFLVGFIPYVLAFFSEDAHHIFSGTLHYSEDMETYRLWINQSASGHWLFSNPYSITEHPAVYLNTLWLLLGKGQAFLALSFSVTFQILRLLACLVLVSGFFSLLSLFSSDKITKTLVTLIWMFSGGIGWMHAAGWSQATTPPLDLYTALFPFTQSMLVPHAALAHGLALWVCVLAYRAMTTLSCQNAIQAGFLLLFLASFRIYDALIVLCVLGLILLFHVITSKRKKTAVAISAWILVPSLPMLLYTAWLTTSAPGFSVWSESNQYPAPDILTLLRGLGFWVFSPLLIGGMLIKNNGGWKHWSLPFVALGVLGAALYSGLCPFAWRTTTLLVTPLALFLFFGLRLLQSRILHIALFSLLLVCMIPSSWVVLEEKVTLAKTQNRYYFINPDILEACEWLKENRNNTLVLTHGYVSLRVAATTHSRVILGHKDLTEDFVRKRGNYYQFLKSANENAALTILNNYHVETLLWGPLERRFSALNPDRLPGFTRLFENGLVSIYGRE